MIKTATTGNRAEVPPQTEQSAQAENQSPSTAGIGRAPKWLVAIVLFMALLIPVLAILVVVNQRAGSPPGASLAPVPAQYDADRAFDVLVQLCKIGPRPSGSPGMKQQQELLIPLFERAGGKVSLQTFEIRHPENGSPVPMANLIASWHPDRPKRFLVCATTTRGPTLTKTDATKRAPLSARTMEPAVQQHSLNWHIT